MTNFGRCKPANAQMHLWFWPKIFHLLHIDNPFIFRQFSISYLEWHACFITETMLTPRIVANIFHRQIFKYQMVTLHSVRNKIWIELNLFENDRSQFPLLMRGLNLMLYFFHSELHAIDDDHCPIQQIKPWELLCLNYHVRFQLDWTGIVGEFGANTYIAIVFLLLLLYWIATTTIGCSIFLFKRCKWDMCTGISNRHNLIALFVESILHLHGSLLHLFFGHSESQLIWRAMIVQWTMSTHLKHIQKHFNHFVLQKKTCNSHNFLWP